MSRAWSPKTALVTGASSGIGREVALELARRGLTVIAAARRREALERLAGESDGRIVPFALDVADDAQTAAVAPWLAERGLSVDLLVNNAGYACPGPVETVRLDAIRRQLDVNLVGLVAVTQAILSAMREADKGRIVNVSSVAGLLSLPFLGVYSASYSASKFAVKGISNALRLKLRPFGLDVRLIEPAAITTSFTDTALDQVRKDSEEGSPYARRHDPQRLRDASESNAAPIEVAVEAWFRLRSPPTPAHVPSLHRRAGVSLPWSGCCRPRGSIA